MKTHRCKPLEAKRARFPPFLGALPEASVRLPRLALPLAIAGHGPVADAAGAVQDGGLGNVDPIARKTAVAAGLRIRLAQNGALVVQPAFERAQSREGTWVDAGQSDAAIG